MFGLVSTGATDYNTAVRKACKNLYEKGLVTIDYESGRHTSLEAAVRRNIMGGLGLMQEKISEDNHDKYGADGWEISAHAASAPDHEPIQGKQYRDDEYKELNDSLVRRIGTLNCGHAAFPIFYGITKPTYTAEQLEQFKKSNAEGITYQGKHYTKYEATQMQRKLERSIRKCKREITVREAAGDEEKLKIAQVRYTRLNQEYARFSKAAGLRTQTERLHTAGFDYKQGKAAAKAAEKPLKSVAKSAESGMIDYQRQANKIVENAHYDYGDDLVMSAVSNLNDDDVYAINRYISSESYVVNEKLRTQLSLSDDERGFVRILDVALGKLPNYEGTVHRSISAECIENVEMFWKEHTAGNVIMYDAYTSTSLDVYDETMDIQMVIKSKRGKDISMFNSSEKEILFKRGTLFRITDVKENTIYMEEL